MKAEGRCSRPPLSMKLSISDDRWSEKSSMTGRSVIEMSLLCFWLLKFSDDIKPSDFLSLLLCLRLFFFFTMRFSTSYVSSSFKSRCSLMILEAKSAPSDASRSSVSLSSHSTGLMLAIAFLLPFLFFFFFGDSSSDVIKISLIFMGELPFDYGSLSNGELNLLSIF